MTDTVTGRVREVSDLLRDDLRVDLDLAPACEQAEAQVGDVQRAVRARLRALGEAQRRVTGLLSDLDRIAALAHLTDAGWPQRRGALLEMFAADPSSGLAAWVDDAADAIVQHRSDALRRLSGELPVPAALAAHTRVVAGALDSPSMTSLARPTIEQLAAGLQSSGGGEPIPDVRRRAALNLCAARLAAVDGEDPSALLQQAGELGADELAIALVRATARRHRHTGEDTTAVDAEWEGSADIGAVVEQARAALAANRPAQAYEVATDALAERSSVIGVDRELDALIEPAPACVWLAVAERALDDRLLELARVAADHAADLVDADDYATSGRTWDVRARLATLDSNATSDEVASFLNAAARQHLWAGNTAGSVERFEGALARKPDDIDYALSLADALMVHWSERPTRESRRHLERGLALIADAHARGGLETHTWSLLDHSLIELELADTVDDERVGHLFTALLVGVRCVVRRPQDGSFWAPLSQAVHTLGLYRTTAAIAARCDALARTDQDRAAAREEIVKVSANLGDYDTSLRRLGQPGQPWDFSVRGYIALRQGAADLAIEDLRKGSPAGWSRQSLLEAMLVAGRVRDAQEQAALMRQETSDRLDDVDGLSAAAMAELVLGDVQRAEELARRLQAVQPVVLDEGFGLFVQGAAHLLDGRDSGVDLLQRAAASSRTPRDLGDWLAVGRPMIERLAEHRHATLPDLSPVTAAHERRSSVLASTVDPLAELAEFRDQMADDPRASTAIALTIAVVQALQASSAAAQATARQLAEPATFPEADRVAAALETIARSDGPTLDPPTESPGDDDAADDEAEPARRIRLEVPPSVFDGYADREAEHELFVRLLPSMRVGADWALPGIAVSLDDELEPGGYRVSFDEVPAEQASLDMSARYDSADAATLLGVEATPSEVPGLWTLHPLDERAPAAQLTTLSPLEAAVERLRALADDRRSLLET
jgi:tetratricopeptide (TPR) repeat protein